MIRGLGSLALTPLSLKWGLEKDVVLALRAASRFDWEAVRAGGDGFSSSLRIRRVLRLITTASV